MKKTISIILASLFLAVGLCSCKTEPEVIPPEPPQVHEHTPEATWQHDETNHWHKCTGCDELLDKAAHTFTDWEIVKEATCTEEGTKTRKCSVCNYKETVKIEKIAHTPETNWDYDATKHWHNCSGCETHLDEGVHDFGEWIMVTEATCQQTGLKERVCKVCNYKESVEIPLTKHTIDSVKYEKAPTETTEKANIIVKCLYSSTHNQKIEVPISPLTDWEETIDSVQSCTSDGSKTYIPKDEKVLSWYELLSEDFKTEENKEKLLANKAAYFKFTVGSPKLGHLINENSLIYEKTPTYSEEGILKVKCLREGCTHEDTITLPVVSDVFYTITETGTCRDGIKVEAVLDSPDAIHLFDNTMLEGKADLITLVMTHKFEFTIPSASHSTLVAEVIKLPTHSLAGEYSITCSRCDCSYTFELPIPNFIDYILKDDPAKPGNKIYRLTDEYPLVVGWNTHFDTESYESSKVELLDALEFSLTPIETEWSARPVMSKDDPIVVDYRYKLTQEVLGAVNLPSINTLHAYEKSYVTRDCSTVVQAWTLTNYGLQQISGYIAIPEDYMKAFKQALLTSPIVFTRCDTAEEEALNRDPSVIHNFSIVSFDTGKTNGQGQLLVECSACNRRFRYNFQYYDVFDDIDGSYVFNSSNLIRIIKNQSRSFTQNDLDSLERVILDYEQAHPEEF